MLAKCLLFLCVHGIFGDNSFTMVVDTTGSMVDEIEIIKNNLQSLIIAMTNNNFYNYILLPFFHLDPGPALISQSPERLVDLVNTIEVNERTNNCRENSLSAIQKALEVSKPRSRIFVFTDAEANDPDRLYSIQSLCENRQSQVIIFQSGTCIEQNSKLATDNVYKKIVSSCGGTHLFFSYLNDLGQAFKYMQEMTRVDWSEIKTQTEFYGSKQYSFSVDTYTKDVLIAISGNIPNIDIKNDFGEKAMVNEIIATSTMKVVRVVNAVFGEYTADISCQGSTMFTFYKKKEVSFRYGFSPLQPKSLRETTQLPIPGIINNLLISLPGDNLDLVSIHLKMSDEQEHITFDHRIIDENKKLYAATILIEPMKSFKVLVKCRDRDNQEISGTTKQIKPQQLVKEPHSVVPKAEILDKDPIINFATAYSIACKVKSYPKPEVWWENSDGERLKSESVLLEIPHVYISYVTIENATKNETITCKCKNSDDTDEVSTNIYIYRPFIFEIIQAPADITVEYGSQGKLFCEANAYPEAEVKWYHNGTVIESSEDIEIIEDEQMLFIKNMILDYTGIYNCEISNGIESRTYMAEVSISGLETPQIDLGYSEVLLKPGERTEQQCTIIKGKPIPEISWKYKSSYDKISLDDVPMGVQIDGGAFKINSADINHSGFYVCEAINILGMDTREVELKIQYPPRIKDGDELRNVNFGEKVELKCEVDAVEKATVHWDLYMDDVIIPFDAGHSTDDRNTHRFIANANDSGMYVCMAQNNAGTAMRTVTVNVLVPPYIEALPWKTLTVRNGSRVPLSCNVISGNPVPATQWRFIAPNLNTTVLLRGNSAGRLDLVLEDVTKKHQGSYQCIAVNDVGVDTVKVAIKVIY